MTTMSSLLIRLPINWITSSRVAAVDRYDKLAVFSNYGLTNVHLAAPGVDIFSTYNGSDTDYQFLQGTSMASPHVAGVAALVVARYPAIPLFELVERLMLSAVQIPALTNKCRTEGRVNAHNALTGNTDGILEIGVTPSGTILLQPSTNVISARVSTCSASPTLRSLALCPA